jgi:hypothetical protein
MIPFITEKQVDDKMDVLGENYFKETKSFLINIPNLIAHKDFLDQLPEFIIKS